MKAVSVPCEEGDFFSISIFLVDFLLFENYIQPEVKRLAKIKSFPLLQWQFLFYFYSESSFLLLEMVSKIFSPIFASWEDILVKVMSSILRPSSTCPDPAERRMVSSKPLCRRSAYLLQERPSAAAESSLLSPFVKTGCMPTSRHAMLSSQSCRPCDGIPTTTSHQLQRSHYLLANWDQRRKWMLQFLISQKCSGN